MPDQLRDGVVQLSFEVIAVLSRAAARHDLSLTQLRMLGVLRDREPRMAELADFLGLDRSTVSGLVDRAVGRGLVRRIGDTADGRVVQVTLTPAARQLGVGVAEEVSAGIAPLIGGLTSAEQRRLTVLLDRILGGSG